jgi:secretion/DNA translocation related TadE-like protein
LVLTFGLLFIAAGMAGAAIGAVRVGRHEARTAADLGALAGARHAIEGRDVACTAAARIVEANGGVLVACDTRGMDLVVTAEVPALTLHARATARAGPVMPP